MVSSRRGPAVLLVAMLMAVAPAAPPAQAMGKAPAEAVDAQLTEYRRVLLAYLKNFNLLPIVLPAGQKPGDVFDLKQKGVLRSRAEECFPGLSQPPAVSSALAYTFHLESSKAGLGLGLPSLATLDAGAEFESDVVVNYTSVKVTSVSQQALVAAVSDACKDVAAVVRQSEVPLSAPMQPPLLAVVGTLVTAKRQIFIGAKRNVDLKASADKLGTILSATGIGAALKVVGLDPSMSVALGFGGKSGLLVQSDEELPVAFMPAFIPEILLASMQGGSSEGPKPISLHWRPFDAADADSAKLFGTLVDAAIKQ